MKAFVPVIGVLLVMAFVVLFLATVPMGMERVRTALERRGWKLPAEESPAPTAGGEETAS